MESALARSTMVAEYGRIAGLTVIQQVFGDAIAIVTESGELHLLDPLHLRPVGAVHHSLPAASALISYGASMPSLVVGTSNGQAIRLQGLDLQLAEPTVVEAHNTSVVGLASLRSGERRLLFSASTDRLIHVHYARTLEPFGDIELDGLPVSIHADGQFLMVATTAGSSVLSINSRNSNLDGGLSAIAWRATQRMD